jgi:quinolinate synthase
VLSVSDYIGSTLDLINYAHKSPCGEFIVCTEVGVLYQLQRENPEKKFYFPEPMLVCADMKTNTLENLVSVLENENNEILIDKAVRERALLPLEKMLELAK